MPFSVCSSLPDISPITSRFPVLEAQLSLVTVQLSVSAHRQHLAQMAAFLELAHLSASLGLTRQDPGSPSRLITM